MGLDADADGGRGVDSAEPARDYQGERRELARYAPRVSQAAAHGRMGELCQGYEDPRGRVGLVCALLLSVYARLWLTGML